MPPFTPSFNPVGSVFDLAHALAPLLSRYAAPGVGNSPSAAYGPTVPNPGEPNGPIAAGGAAPQPPAAPFPGYLSPAEQQAQAVAHVQALLGPILGLYTGEEQQARNTGLQDASFTTGAYNALAGILANAASHVHGDYSQAANADAGYAKGYSGQLQDTLNQSAQGLNNELQTVAPGTKQTVSAPAVSDLLYGTQGALPANMLQQQGAAFGAAADMLPASTARQGVQQAQQQVGQGNVNANKIRDTALEYAASNGPSFFNQALATIGANQAKLLGDYNTNQYRGAQLGLTEQQRAEQQRHDQATEGTASVAAQNTAANQRLDAGIRQAQAMSASGVLYQYDPKTGQVAPAKDAKGNVIETPQGRAVDINQYLAGVHGKQAASQAAVAQTNATTSRMNAQTRAAAARADAAYKLAQVQLSSQRISVAQGNARTALRREINQENRYAATAKTAEQKQAWTEAQNEAKAKSSSGLIFTVTPDAKGYPVVQPWLVNGRPMLTAAAQKQTAGLKPVQIQQFKGDAALIAQNAFNGFVDAKNAKHPPISYADALNEMRIGIKHGAIPISIAIAALNAVYPEGQRGRPVSQQTLANPASGLNYLRMTGVTDRVVVMDKNGHYVGTLGKTDPGFRRAYALAKQWDGNPSDANSP